MSKFRSPSPPPIGWLLVLTLVSPACTRPPTAQPAAPPTPSIQTASSRPPSPAARATPAPPPEPSPALLRDTAAVLTAFANYAPVWSNDGRHLLFLSTREGSAAAWASSWAELDLPPNRLGVRDLLADTVIPARDNLSAFLLSHNGDRSSLVLLRVDVASNASSELAAFGPDSLGRVRFAHRNRSVASFATRGAGATTVWTIQPADPSPKQAAVLPGAWDLLDLSPAASHALLAGSTPHSPRRIVEVELSHGTTVELARPAAASDDLRDACYGRDRRDVWLAGSSATGEGCVFPIRTSTASAEPYCVNGSTTMRTVRSSPGGGRLVLDVAWEDRSEIQFIDPRTSAKRAVAQLPMGAGTLGGFSPTGKVVTVAWETPSSPPDLFEVDPLQGTVRKLRKDVRPTLALFEEMDSRHVLLEPAGGQPWRVLVHAPASAWIGRSKGHPVVVLLRNPGLPRLRWSPLVRLLVARGFAIVEPWGATGEPDLASATPQRQSQRIEQLAAWAAAQPWSGAERVGIIETATTGRLAFALHQALPEVAPVAVELRDLSLDRSCLWPSSADSASAPPSIPTDNDHELEIPPHSSNPAASLARVVAVLEHSLTAAPTSRAF